MKKLLACAILAATLTGCATVPMGDAKQDAVLKTFTPKADKTGVYIYRNEFIGAAIHMDVAVDGKPIGQTVAKTYLYKEVEPGQHTITSTSENEHSIVIDAKPGTLMYIWQEVKMGVLYARTKLHQVSEAEGRSGVMETSLAETK